MAFRSGCYVGQRTLQSASERRAPRTLAHLLLVTAAIPWVSACGRWGYEELPPAELIALEGTDGSVAKAPVEPALPEADASVGFAEIADAASPQAPVDAGEVAPLEPQVGHLVHHYRFDGTGLQVVDSVGDAHGQLEGATLADNGEVVLPGGLSGPHVTLPSGMISRFESVSIEAWVTWQDGGGYQHVFDFGNSSLGVGQQGNGTRNFSLALVGGKNFLRLLFDASPAEDSKNWRAIFSTPTVTLGEVHQVVAVFDRGQNQIRLYVDGNLRGSAAVPADEGLSDIDDQNAWLGMGQWAADPNFNGTMHDFRIYDSPLTDAEVATRFEARYR